MISPTVSPEEWPWKVEIDVWSFLAERGYPRRLPMGNSSIGEWFSWVEEYPAVISMLDENDAWLRQNNVDHYLTRTGQDSFYKEQFTQMSRGGKRSKVAETVIPTVHPKGWLYHFKSQEAATLFKLFRGT